MSEEGRRTTPNLEALMGRGNGKETAHGKWIEAWEKYFKHWRKGLGGNYPAPAGMAWHKAVKLGADPHEMLRGARIFTETILPNIEPEFQPSPTKWITGWAWELYQDEPRRTRELTLAEQNAWWSAAQKPPASCWEDEEFCGPRPRAIKH